MSGYRRAAAALYQLSAVDREWIFSELPDADRAILTQHVDELESLGFIPDEAIFNELSFPRCANLAPMHSIDWVRNATPEHIARVLFDEPATLIARLIAGQDWPWSTSFLQMLSPMRQEQVRCAKTTFTGETTVCTQSLVDAVASRLKRHHQQHDTLQVDAVRAVSRPARIHVMRKMLASLMSLTAGVSWKR